MSNDVSAVSLASGLTQQAYSSSATTTGTDLGKDEFLKLMLAQLQNQDPLNPVDSTAFVTQTAQFTSLEQLQNIYSAVTSLATEVAGYSRVGSASALLGKTVAFNGSPVTLDGGTPTTLSYALPASAQAVMVQVLDASGNAVRTLNGGEQSQGTHRISFDGKADDGTTLAPGTYAYQVAAVDSAGNVLSGVYTGTGSVTGITNNWGALMLQVGSQSVPLSSVVGVLAGTDA